MSDTSQPRLLSFALDDWTVLGGRVSLTLTNKVAVLVGRNGAGKSAILEGLTAISSIAMGRLGRVRQNEEDSIPKVLEILISTPDNRQLEYRYELITTLVPDDSDIDDSDSDNSEEIYSWNDQCSYADGDKELLWTTETGVTTLHIEGDKYEIILGSTNLLRQIRLKFLKNTPQNLHLPDEMEWIYDVLWEIRLLGISPVRQTWRRRPSLLRTSRKRSVVRGFGLADSLSRRILRLMEKGELDELESVCQRIGIGKKITIQKFVSSKDSGKEDETGDEESLSSVSLDGTNIGLLSDGTLRVLAILLEVMSTSSNATIIIEEPELQIHPGMLAKLLTEIEVYTFDKNLIISTHSPQVVSRTNPREINLVYRNENQTFVRQLEETEIENVVEYLNEEGDLGEWLYSGILDE